MITPLNLRKASLLLLVVLTTGIAKAQTFGGNPPSIKWKQVNTPEAKVIFPAGMDTTGWRVADIIHKMSGPIKQTIGYKQKQVSIVLQNQYTVSNGYVQLAPFRSEFFLTPQQNSFNLGTLNWADQLAIHEYRHVQQYNNFNVGLSKGLRTIFGEGGQALGNELSVPDWFFEGDAVYNETWVSDQGRGRIPYFFNGYRALWAEGKNYSYMKLRNGSYRDYTPDHYPLGYMLVSYGRQKYGIDIWNDVTHNAAAYKSLFNPFQKAFKHKTGQDFNKFTTEAFVHFKDQFIDDRYTGWLMEPNSHNHMHVSNPKQHFIADQEYPAYVDEHTLVYMKTTYNHRPVFVLRTTGIEKELRVRDLSLDNYFGYRDGKIVYAAYQPDARWEYRTYNDLRVLDIHTGQQKQLTHHTKYFSPDFSADGKKIVAVDVQPSGRNILHILDADNGKLLAVVPNPDHLVYTYPKFYGDDQIVAAVRNADGTSDIALINIKTGQAKNWSVPGYSPVGFTAVSRDTIYFTATDKRRDKLFAITANNDRLYSLENDSLQHTIGNYQPAISNKNVAWVSFTAEGYQVNQADKQTLSWTPVNGNELPVLDNMDIRVLNDKDPATAILSKVDNTPLAVTKYHKAYHLFNFHSLIPAFDDPNYSISLVGENVLNTFQSNLLFNYNRDEGYKEFGFSGTYGGWYPYVSSAVDYTVDRKGYYKGNNIYWNETEVSAGAQVPLVFTNGRSITNISFGSSVVYNSTNFQPAYRSQFADRSYTYLNSTITLSNRISQARQNIYPRFAQSLTLNYKNAFTGITANQFLASGTLFLPGFSANHNLVINVAYQQKNKSSVISFSNNFPFSRGYEAENLYKLEKIGANYHFPIAYPDAGFANFIYVLRLRGNVFYDYTHANDFYTDGNSFKADFRTVGAEVYFDTSWFNQVPITFGLRYSYLLDDDVFGGYGRNRIELIVPLTLF